MKTSSAKAKGRRAQYWLRDKVYEYLNNILVNSGVWNHSWSEDHVMSRPMASPGEDLIISPTARQWFPFAPECKNSERIGFWPTVVQAESNSRDHIPLILFMKNRTRPWIAIPADEFFDILNLAALARDDYNTLFNEVQEDQT